MSILNSTKTGLQRYAMYICNYEEFYKKTLVDYAFFDTKMSIIKMGKRQAKQQFKNRNIKKNVYLYLISKNTTTKRFKVLMQISIPMLFPGYVANHKKDFKDANEFLNKNFPLYLRKRTKYIKSYEETWKNKINNQQVELCYVLSLYPYLDEMDIDGLYEKFIWSEKSKANLFV